MRTRKWLRVILIFAVLLVAASIGFSRALRSEAARSYLLTHLSASFGRPVEVERFDFSLLDGARLEAHSVTVAEDPRFGNEYFLRAETLTAGLHWQALFQGRFEFGSLALERPSLNLARDREGHWNIERWLPPASSAASRPGFVGPLAAPRSVRLYRIQVDGGRINFKQSDDKSPFALLDVSGRVEQDSAGRWQLDVEARPMRAGVGLQDIGTLRLRGSIAGTSARLQPASLNLTWRDASVADALRLARQGDYGMRGELSVDLNATVAPPDPALLSASQSSAAQWSISGVARLAGIHSWRLPGRNTDPSANLSVETAWRLGEPRAQIKKLLLEMPGTRLQGSGDLDWAHGFQPQFTFASSSVGLSDILSWYRSLHPDVAEGLRAQGLLEMEMTIGGWPLTVQRGGITSAGGTLSGSPLASSFQLGPLTASVTRAGGVDISPTSLSFAAIPTEGNMETDSVAHEKRSAFLLRGSISPHSGNSFRWPFDWNMSVEGSTSRTQDWLTLSQALAQPLNRGWTAAGGLEARMTATHRSDVPATAWLGTMDFRDLTLSPEHVNQPLLFPKAHVEFAPQLRSVTLFEAEAFGAQWHGSLSRKIAERQWNFDLSADVLDTAELDRWLGPRARSGFLARFTNLGAPVAANPEVDSGAAQLVAHGRLRVAEILISPMRLDQFDGQVELDGRTFTMRKAQANFFGGTVAGTLDAQLVAEPRYQLQARFERVNLAQLARGVSFLSDRIAGTTSATLSIAAHGVGRASLIASMEGSGMLNAKNAEISALDLSGAFPGGEQDPTPASFATAQGTFVVHSSSIELSNFILDHAQGRLRADGRIDFSHALRLNFRPSILQANTSPDSASPPSILVTGTIEDPKITQPSQSPKNPPRSGK